MHNNSGVGAHRRPPSGGAGAGASGGGSPRPGRARPAGGRGERLRPGGPGAPAAVLTRAGQCGYPFILANTRSPALYSRGRGRAIGSRRGSRRPPLPPSLPPTPPAPRTRRPGAAGRAPAGCDAAGRSRERGRAAGNPRALRRRRRQEEMGCVCECECVRGGGGGLGHNPSSPRYREPAGGGAPGRAGAAGEPSPRGGGRARRCPRPPRASCYAARSIPAAAAAAPGIWSRLLRITPRAATENRIFLSPPHPSPPRFAFLLFYRYTDRFL